MKKPAAMLHLLFACLLLFAQQVALAHGYSHSLPASQSAPVSQKDSLPGETLCDECLACAAFGAALATSLAPAAFADFQQDLALAAKPSEFLAFFIRFFDGRAPPFEPV